MEKTPGSLDHLRAISLLEPGSAVWAVDENLTITFWSDGAQELLGYTSAEVVGKHCSAAVSCVSCASGCGMYMKRNIQAREMSHYHKDGHRIHARKWAQALLDDQDRFLGGVEILRPVSQPSATTRSTGELVDFHGILTADPAFLALLAGLRNLAHTQVNVLIRGETGTGKEMVARAIHKMSPRSAKPFVALNCGTLSRELITSEIFGHRRGAFTGAHADKQGLLAMAEGGTLLLDEVAELPLDVQAMLLRVVQERRYTPLGDTRDRPTDIRIISATHCSLREAVAQKRFREDLMYRLRVVPVFLPPLRERKGDVLKLWHMILQRETEKMKREPARVSQKVLAILASYGWPGNVRELINLAEYIAVTRGGSDVHPEHLLPELFDPQNNQTPISDRLSDSRRQAVEEALAQADGSSAEAARLLGVSRATLWRWRKKLGLV